MPGPAIIRTVLGALACAAATGWAPVAALAEGGGGNSSCPWQQEVSLALDGKTLTIPPTVFEAKGAAPVIDGYEMQPDVNALVLRVVGPRGELWEAALTRVGAKRCTGFYVGKPVLVAGPPPVAPRPPKSSVAVR